MRYKECTPRTGDVRAVGDTIVDVGSRQRGHGTEWPVVDRELTLWSSNADALEKLADEATSRLERLHEQFRAARRLVRLEQEMRAYGLLARAEDEVRQVRYALLLGEDVRPPLLPALTTLDAADITVTALLADIQDDSPHDN